MFKITAHLYNELLRQDFPWMTYKVIRKSPQDAVLEHWNQ